MLTNHLIRIALADDHDLIRRGIAQLLEQEGFVIVADAGNGKDLIDKIDNQEVDIILMDISMPMMDGIETTKWISRHKPEIRIIALTMMDDDMHVIRMLRAGARGYLVKNTNPSELVFAIRDVYERGYHMSELVSGRLIRNIQSGGSSDHLDKAATLTDREIEFLRHCCTEMTYKEIGNLMHVSPRTAEGYSKSLCEKLQLKSRVGLVLYAIKNRIEVI